MRPRFRPNSLLNMLKFFVNRNVSMEQCLQQNTKLSFLTIRNTAGLQAYSLEAS